MEPEGSLSCSQNTNSTYVYKMLQIKFNI